MNGAWQQLAIGAAPISDSLKDGNMADANGGNTPHGWTSTQAYIMAVLCLLVGCAVGYLLRGSVGGSSAPAPAAAGAEQQPGVPQQGMPPGAAGGMGQQQAPTPQQMKAMADKQAEPLLAQLKSNPNDPALLSQIGNIYYDAQVFPVAIDYYQKCLAANPKNSQVRTDMATALFYSNDPEHAIEEFDHVLKEDPKNGNALFNRGIVKWQAKMDVKGAVADWELLLKENPNYEQADKVKMYIAQAKKHADIKPGQKTDKPAM
jgi:cytochrome c-type biogenesis protein CcmH/NrfG